MVNYNWSLRPKIKISNDLIISVFPRFMQFTYLFFTFILVVCDENFSFYVWSVILRGIIKEPVFLQHLVLLHPGYPSFCALFLPWPRQLLVLTYAPPTCPRWQYMQDLPPLATTTKEKKKRFIVQIVIRSYMVLSWFSVACQLFFSLYFFADKPKGSVKTARTWGRWASLSPGLLKPSSTSFFPHFAGWTELERINVILSK